MRPRLLRSVASVGPCVSGVAVAVTICLLAVCSAGADNGPVKVQDVRHWSVEEGTRVVIDLSGHVDFSKERLSNPERVFFDLKNSKLGKGVKTQLTFSEGPCRAMRLGQFNANTVRVVFDIEPGGSAFQETMRVLTLDDPPRLVIDFVSKRDPKRESEPVPERVVRKRIVIDPGHGGEDPGAVGYRGLYEKDVVLDIALRARDMIRAEYPGYEVLLTRERDVFIPLQERTAFGNRHKADLFVSIHANASPRRQTRGVETYLLNWTNDEESMRVAARENAISLKKMREVQDEVGVILASLERENKRDESGKLARLLQDQMVSGLSADYAQITDLGVKQALFYVLVDARMPSALVEVSFVSNPQEERLLSIASYRKKIASSIVRGVHSYFSSAPVQKVAYLKPPAGSPRRAQAAWYTVR